MHEDALAELDTIGPGDRDQPEVVECRLMILIHAERWEEALALSERFLAMAPTSPGAYIHRAFCLHELGRTGEARDLLLNAPEEARTDPTYFYNLGCYEVALGDREKALAHLNQSFKMSKKHREYAKTDPDLDPIRHLL